MQIVSSNLKDLVPLWEREVAQAIHDTKHLHLGSRDVHVCGPARSELVIGNPGPLAQDVFYASIIRQGAVKRAL